MDSYIPTKAGAQASGFGFQKSPARPKADSGQVKGSAWPGFFRPGLAWLLASGWSRHITITKQHDSTLIREDERLEALDFETRRWYENVVLLQKESWDTILIIDYQLRQMPVGRSIALWSPQTPCKQGNKITQVAVLPDSQFGVRQQHRLATICTFLSSDLPICRSVFR